MDTFADDLPSPFAIPDLWRKSAFTLTDADYDETLFSSQQELINAFPDLTLENHDLRDTFATALQLPDLETFSFGTLEGLNGAKDGVEQSSTAGEEFNSDPEGARDEEDDLWAGALAVVDEEPRLRSWEAFVDVNFSEPRTKYLSEAGPGAFDAAVDRLPNAGFSASGGTNTGGSEILQTGFLLKSLALLGLGRSSVLFVWDSSARRFVQTLSQVRPSGFSLLATTSVVAQLERTGTAFVLLREFVEKTYNGRQPNAAKIALARCVRLVLETLDRDISGQALQAGTVLRVLDCFRVAGEILNDLQVVVKAVARETTVLGTLVATRARMAAFAEACSPYCDIYANILDRVSTPWLSGVCKTLGLAGGADGLSCLGQFVDLSTVPTDILSESDKRGIGEIWAGLDILKEPCPDHPLLNQAAWQVQPPDFDDHSVAVHASRVLDKARQYELDLARAIEKYDRGEMPSAYSEHYAPEDIADENNAWLDNEQQQAHFALIGNQFSLPPDQTTRSQDDSSDGLRSLVLIALHPSSAPDDVFEQQRPNDILAPLRPYLAPLAATTSHSSVHMLFISGLRHHVSLNHAFHLLAHPQFLIRLSTALFSSSTATAARVSGQNLTGVNMGLRLENRGRAWPPGGSELRLALMGVLSDSYASLAADTTAGRSPAAQDAMSLHSLPTRAAPAAPTTTTNLPGALSFAIRELSSEEIDAVLDPSALEALDFLRLTYSPPAPLHVIFTPDVLAIYDDLFRAMLRVLRVLHLTTSFAAAVAERGSSSSHERISRHRIAFVRSAHLFATALASWAFESAVGGPWKHFQTVLDTYEAQLGSQASRPTSAHSYASELPVEHRISLNALCEAHEQMLQRIRSCLFLRHKQFHVRDAIDRVMRRILRFARDHGSGDESSGRDESDAATVRESAKEALDGLRWDVKDVVLKVREWGRREEGKNDIGLATGQEREYGGVEEFAARLDFGGYYAGDSRGFC